MVVPEVCEAGGIGGTSKVIAICEMPTGIIGVNGHRSVGGYRASLYNALKIDSVEALIDCMKKLESLIKK